MQAGCRFDQNEVDYKYILVLLFLKKLSDEWKKEYNEALKTLLDRGLSREEAEELAKD